MSIIIHDLRREDFASIFPEKADSPDVIYASENISFCRGCEECWKKGSNGCVYEGRTVSVCEMFMMHEQVNIISSCLYGGYSIPVKSVLEKTISYSYPQYSVGTPNTHHVMKVNKKLYFNVIFYGNISDAERNIAWRIVKGNCYFTNLEDWRHCNVTFLPNFKSIKAKHIQDVDLDEEYVI